VSSTSRPCLGLLWDGGNSESRPTTTAGCILLVVDFELCLNLEAAAGGGPTRKYFARCGFELCLNLQVVEDDILVV
jgi:hypothetical protein